MTREELSDALDRIEALEHPGKDDLKELEALRSICDQRQYFDEFYDRGIELEEYLTSKIVAQRLVADLGGEPLGPAQLTELVNLCRKWQYPKDDSKERKDNLFGACYLFKLSVNHPDTLDLVLDRQRSHSPEEIVELAMQPKIDTTIYL